MAAEWKTTRSISTNFFVHVTYGHGLVLLRHGDEMHGEWAILGVLPHEQCIVQHSIWEPYKNGWTDWRAVWDDEWAWPEERCVTWGWRSLKGKGQFWRKTCLTSLTPLWIVNWTGPCSSVHTTGADAWLQWLDEFIIGRDGGIAHCGRSLISLIALSVYA